MIIDKAIVYQLGFQVVFEKHSITWKYQMTNNNKKLLCLLSKMFLEIMLIFSVTFDLKDFN